MEEQPCGLVCKDTEDNDPSVTQTTSLTEHDKVEDGTGLTGPIAGESAPNVAKTEAPGTDAHAASSDGHVKDNGTTDHTDKQLMNAEKKFVEDVTDMLEKEHGFKCTDIGNVLSVINAFSRKMASESKMRPPAKFMKRASKVNKKETTDAAMAAAFCMTLNNPSCLQCMTEAVLKGPPRTRVAREQLYARAQIKAGRFIVFCQIAGLVPDNVASMDDPRKVRKWMFEETDELTTMALMLRYSMTLPPKCTFPQVLFDPIRYSKYGCGHLADDPGYSAIQHSQKTMLSLGEHSTGEAVRDVTASFVEYANTVHERANARLFIIEDIPLCFLVALTDIAENEPIYASWGIETFMGVTATDCIQKFYGSSDPFVTKAAEKAKQVAPVRLDILDYVRTCNAVKKETLKDVLKVITDNITVFQIRGAQNKTDDTGKTSSSSASE